MDLKSGYPFWAIKNGLMHSFPQLERDLRCDVVIMGGGITGALIADELSRHGHDVALVEQRDIGWGSTAASTALLQYEIDTHLIDLAERYGDADASLAYRSCVTALSSLQVLAKRVRDVDFQAMRSLYLASKPAHVPTLQRELALRKKHGIRARWMAPDELRHQFAVEAPGGILSASAARVDPYRLTYGLLRALTKSGASVFDRTAIVKIERSARRVKLVTSQGATVSASHLVIAAGYATQQWLKQRVSTNRSSYAFVTDPLPPSSLGPLQQTMVWESARPYLYMRATGDGRLIVGGEDDDVDIPARRDRKVDKKAKLLRRKVEKRFPHLSIEPAFAWAGTFAETKDGLPFFGPHSEYGPRVHLAMAYGGNGITYSVLGAALIRAAIEGREHALAELFSFDRLTR